MMSGVVQQQHHYAQGIPPEEVGHEVPNNHYSSEGGMALEGASLQQHHEKEAMQPTPSQNNNNRSATLSSPWQYDVSAKDCTACRADFHALNRRHHCRLCGKVFCHECSSQKALIPPSSIVLVPRGGKKAKPIDMMQNDDPDRMLTYLTGGDANELLYGKGLEERFKLAREPLRVCQTCFGQLAPLQEDLRASNSNAMRFNHIDPTDSRRLFNSPIAHTLGHEIRKAAYTLNNLLPQPRRMGALVSPTNLNNINGDASELQACKENCSAVSPNLGDLDGVRIPARLLEEAKGIAVMTVMKGGLGLAGFEFGTGLVVARVGSNSSNSSNGGQWSAPSAIGTGGISWGALVGAQVSDHVFLLMNDAAVHMLYSNQGSVQLGADIGIAVGPLGRAVEGNLGAAPRSGVAPIYTYSLSKGLYAGVSLDGKVIVTRDSVNEKFYGRPVTGQEILAGAVPLPPAAQPLYEALARCHVYASQQDGSNGLQRFQQQQQELAAAQLDYRGGASRPELLGSLVTHDEASLAENEFGEWVSPSPHNLPHQAAPADVDQHSYNGGMSDITTDPGY